MKGLTDFILFFSNPGMRGNPDQSLSSELLPANVSGVAQMPRVAEANL